MKKKLMLASTVLLCSIGTLASCGSGAKLVTNIDVVGDEEIERGKEKTYSAKITPEDATNKEVTWSSENTQILSVDEKGVAKGLAEGETSIVATAKDGSKVVGKKTVKVVKPVPIAVKSVSITGAKEIRVGDKPTLTAVVNPANADIKSMLWESNNVNVATIDSNTGVVTALAEGDVQFKVTVTDTLSNVVTATHDAKIEEQIIALGRFKVPSFQTVFESNISSSKQDTVGSIAKIGTTSEGGKTPSTDVSKDKFYYYDDEQKTVSTYKVGNYNDFVYQCQGVYYDSELVEHIIETPKQEFTLYKKENNEFVKIEDDKLGDYLDLSKLDKLKSHFKFKDDVSGTFKLEVLPNKEFYTYSGKAATITFDVISGARNIFSEAEFVALDNVPFKCAILHCDIDMHNESINKNYKWSQDEVEKYIKENDTDWKTFVKIKNEKYQLTEQQCKDLFIDSIKDNCSVITLPITESNPCSIEGNYFHINLDNVKRVIKFDDKSLAEYEQSQGSHSQLFLIQSQNKDNSSTEFRNLSILGNAKKSGSDDSGAGGLIAFKTQTNKITLQNIVATSCFTNVVHEYNALYPDVVGELLIDRCRFTDSYNVMLYIRGIKSEVPININNSFLKDAGGSIMILDETFDLDDKEKPFNIRSPKVNMDNTYAEAFVTGDETWFSTKVIAEIPGVGKITAGTLVKMVAAVALDDGVTFGANEKFYHKYKDKTEWGATCEHKTFGKIEGKEQKINMVSLCICGEHLLNTYKQLDLAIKTNDGANTLLDFNDPIISAYSSAVHQSGGSFNGFQSSKGGTVFISSEIQDDAAIFRNDGTMMSMKNYIDDAGKTPGLEDVQTNFSNLFSGDYVSLYMDIPQMSSLFGLAALFSYK